MARFFNWITNRIRSKRLALTSKINLLPQFSFQQGVYSNWKHDPQPLIFIMYSGQKYTHGININYMNRSDKAWFGRSLYLMKKANQILTGLSMYKYLKIHRYNIVKECYRVYFTSLLNMKLVGSGLTYLDKLVYPIAKDPWLLALNEMMTPGEISSGPTEIAYNPQELQTRISQVYNSIPLQKKSIKKAPYTNNAPWLK